METEDVISLPASSNSSDGIEEGELPLSDSRLSESDFQPGNHNEVKEATNSRENLEGKEGNNGSEVPIADGEKLGVDKSGIEYEEGGAEKLKGMVDGDNFVGGQGDVGIEGGTVEVKSLGVNVGEGDLGTEDNEFSMEMVADMDLVDSPVRPSIIEVTGSVTVKENLTSFIPGSGTRDKILVQSRAMDGRVSGVKRARMTCDEEQPSVHVTYKSLTRPSKRKLEELLQQWSEWHTQHGSSSKDLNEVLESGEGTYFPALRIGIERPSAVSFWIESQTSKELDNGLISVDDISVPFYDRGYALGLTSSDGPSNAEGGLEIVNDAARCFNCGSYSHSLKECRKPRDNAVVSLARKQRKSKRNQNIGSCSATRYYQNSSGGKYDSLKPGSLDTETRQLLGIGELDPPPWLNRMRELGYPPGYLDPDDENQPSGITIFADEDTKTEKEDGEIMETEETDNPEPPKIMSVEFPGINAPIPENADEWLWAKPSSLDTFGNHPHRRLHQSSEPNNSRWHHHDQRRSRDLMDDGPPGVDPIFSPSSYPPRYGHHDSNYGFDTSRSPTYALARSNSDRGRSTLAHENYVSHSSYSSPYSMSNKRSSPHDHGSMRSNRFENENDSWDEYDRHYRSRRRCGEASENNRAWCKRLLWVRCYLQSSPL